MLSQTRRHLRSSPRSSPQNQDALASFVRQSRLQLAELTEQLQVRKALQRFIYTWIYIILYIYINIYLYILIHVLIYIYLHKYIYTFIEHGHRNNGFTHWNRWFSIVMLNYQTAMYIYIYVYIYIHIYTVNHENYMITYSLIMIVWLYEYSMIHYYSIYMYIYIYMYLSAFFL